jgi:hypothetical protein
MPFTICPTSSTISIHVLNQHLKFRVHQKAINYDDSRNRENALMTRSISSMITLSLTKYKLQDPEELKTLSEYTKDKLLMRCSLLNNEIMNEFATLGITDCKSLKDKIITFINLKDRDLPLEKFVTAGNTYDSACYTFDEYNSRKQLAKSFQDFDKIWMCAKATNRSNFLSKHILKLDHLEDMALLNKIIGAQKSLKPLVDKRFSDKCIAKVVHNFVNAAIPEWV